MHARPSCLLGVTIPWLVLSMLVATDAAAEATREQQAAAEALFIEGRQLMASGEFALACARFEQSQTLDSATGTLLNLADCYEKDGRLASAWVTFKSAAAAARRREQTPREQLARERAALLEPRLARLTISVVDGDSVEGLTVTRGGAAIERLLWGQPVPVDAGILTIEAKAPGRIPWRKNVEAVNGQVVTVNIPPLDHEAAADMAPRAAVATGEAAPPKASAATEPRGQRDWVLPAIVGGVGVVLLGGSGYFAMRAASKDSDSKEYCSGSTCTSQRGVDLRDEAVSAGNVATLLFAVGSAGVVGGVVLYFVSDPGDDSATESPCLWASTAAAPGSGTVTLSGKW